MKEDKERVKCVDVRGEECEKIKGEVVCKDKKMKVCVKR